MLRLLHLFHLLHLMGSYRNSKADVYRFFQARPCRLLSPVLLPCRLPCLAPLPPLDMYRFFQVRPPPVPLPLAPRP